MEPVSQNGSRDAVIAELKEVIAEQKRLLIELKHSIEIYEMLNEIPQDRPKFHYN